jgi:hypothetical protein
LPLSGDEKLVRERAVYLRADIRIRASIDGDRETIVTAVGIVRPMRTTPARSKDAWMPVEIRRGLFPGERMVQFRAVDGEEIALFVSSRHVDESLHALKVTVLDENERFTLIDIPSQSGLTVAKVARRGLRPTR